MEIVQVNSIKAWLLAARPKTLAGAATPVLLGCALAYADSCFQMTPALLCFLFAFLMQIDEIGRASCRERVCQYV